MTEITMKLLGLFLLIGGEVLSVYTEMIAAKNIPNHSALYSFAFVKSSAWMGIAGAMLIAGYVISYAAFKNIWIVSAVSVTSILIVEPALSYLVFHELPGRGAVVGLTLGSLGLLATLFLE
jgi:drug/metabolite transporter (DMT)-like permease